MPLLSMSAVTKSFSHCDRIPKAVISLQNSSSSSAPFWSKSYSTKSWSAGRFMSCSCCLRTFEPTLSRRLPSTAPSTSMAGAVPFIISQTGDHPPPSDRR